MILDIPTNQRPCSPDQVLVFYDGPLIFWLPAPDRRLLAMALPDEAGPWPYLVSDMPAEIVTALETGALDLRQAVLASKNYFLADYWASVLLLELLTEVPREEWLPDVGCGISIFCANT